MIYSNTDSGATQANCFACESLLSKKFVWRQVHFADGLLQSTPILAKTKKLTQIFNFFSLCLERRRISHVILQLGYYSTVQVRCTTRPYQVQYVPYVRYTFNRKTAQDDICSSGLLCSFGCVSCVCGAPRPFFFPPRLFVLVHLSRYKMTQYHAVSRQRSIDIVRTNYERPFSPEYYAHFFILIGQALAPHRRCGENISIIEYQNKNAKLSTVPYRQLFKKKDGCLCAYQIEPVRLNIGHNIHINSNSV